MRDSKINNDIEPCEWEDIDDFSSYDVGYTKPHKEPNYNYD